LFIVTLQKQKYEGNYYSMAQQTVGKHATWEIVLVVEMYFAEKMVVKTAFVA